MKYEIGLGHLVIVFLFCSIKYYNNRLALHKKHICTTDLMAVFSVVVIVLVIEITIWRIYLSFEYT